MKTIIIPTSLSLFLLLAPDLRSQSDAPAVPTPTAQETVPPPVELAATAEVEALIEAADFDAALRRIEAALAENAKSPALWALKGRVLRLAGRNDEAIAAYGQLMAMDPGHNPGRHFLGMLLREKANATAGSDRRTLLAQALALLPQESLLVQEYIQACIGEAQWEAAIDAFEASGMVNPPPTLLKQLAQAYRTVNAPEKAVAAHTLLLEQGALTSDELVDYTAWLEANDREQALVDACTLGLKQFPENAQLMRTFARRSLSADRPLEALQILGNLAEMDGESSDLVIMRLELLLKLGGTTLAKTIADAIETPLSPELKERIAAAVADAESQWKAIEDGSPLHKGGQPSGIDGLSVLAYPTSLLSRTPDPEKMDAALLFRHLDYLISRGYHFVSTRDVAAVRRGELAISEGSVLLTFDGASALFEDIALPVLEAYGAPVLLTVGTANIADEHHPIPRAEMTWEALNALAKHALVTVGARGHHLGNAVQSNPQGRLALASVTRRYNRESGTYETEAEYASRIRGDLATAMQLIRSRGIASGDILAWPEGRGNAILTAEARRLGFELVFGTQDTPLAAGADIVRRSVISAPPGMETLVNALSGTASDTVSMPSFGLPASLDFVFEQDGSDATREKIDRLITMVRESHVDVVYLDAFSDVDNDGAADAAYFPNRVLPVRSDILNYVVSLLQYEGVRVFVRLPVLSLKLPEEWRNSMTYVNAYRWGQITPMNKGQPRISPFAPSNRQKIVQLFTDLAIYVPFDGIILGEDAYLADNEDFSDAAAYTHVRRIKLRERNPERFTDEQRKQWQDLKYEQLETLIGQIVTPIRRYRPDAVIGRALFASSVGNDGARAHLSQSFSDTLDRFDRVLITIDANPIGVESVDAWMTDLVERAQAFDNAMPKLIFNIDLLDEPSKDWISRSMWERRAKELAHAGGRHFTFGPYPAGPASRDSAIRKTWDDVRRKVARSEQAAD